MELSPAALCRHPFTPPNDAQLLFRCLYYFSPYLQPPTRVSSLLRAGFRPVRLILQFNRVCLLFLATHSRNRGTIVPFSSGVYTFANLRIMVSFNSEIRLYEVDKFLP